MFPGCINLISFFSFCNIAHINADIPRRNDSHNRGYSFVSFERQNIKGRQRKALYRDGDLGEEVCICEHAYMVALGYNVMPKQWKELKVLMLEPHGREFFNQRVQVKTDHCTVYIADFKERNCDYSAFAGDANILTILLQSYFVVAHRNGRH